MRQHLVTGGQYPGLEVLEPEPERRSRLYLLIILDAGIAWSAVRDADGTLRCVDHARFVIEDYKNIIPLHRIRPSILRQQLHQARRLLPTSRFIGNPSFR